MGYMRFNYKSRELGRYVDVSIVYPIERYTYDLDAHPAASRPTRQYLPMEPGMKFRTVYLIHGGGDDDTMIYRYTAAERYARENNVPYLGICLGMQIAVIEFARNVAGIEDACSGEFHEPSQNKVIDFMPGQSDEVEKGGTLRLGSYPCSILKGSRMEKCYKTLEISERHRHRYEFNNDYRESLQEKGLVLSGLSPDGRLVEAVELKDQDFFIGVQFHPEFKSRPNRPHPLFKGFIEAGLHIM